MAPSHEEVIEYLLLDVKQLMCKPPITPLHLQDKYHFHFNITWEVLVS